MAVVQESRDQTEHYWNHVDYTTGLTSALMTSYNVGEYTEVLSDLHLKSILAFEQIPMCYPAFLELNVGIMRRNLGSRLIWITLSDFGY